MSVEMNKVMFMYTGLYGPKTFKVSLLQSSVNLSTRSGVFHLLPDYVFQREKKKFQKIFHVP